MKTLRNYFTRYKYQFVTLVAHINFFVFFAWWMIPAGIVFNNVVNYLYLHRIYTHKHFRLGERADTVFQFLATMLNLGSPNIYAAVHMKHHRESDTENDPHSPIYTPIWKMLLSLWNPSFAPDRRALKHYKCRFYKRHWEIALFAAVFFPWVTVVAHWMSKIVIISVHRDGKPINAWWWKPLTWGEEMHETHHKKNVHGGDMLDSIGKFLQFVTGGRRSNA